MPWPYSATGTEGADGYNNIGHCSTVSVVMRSFAAAGPRLWNSLPVDVQSAPSLATFRQKLKSHLFRQSYPDIAF